MPHLGGQSTRAIHRTSLKDAHGAQDLPTYNTLTSAFECEALLDGVDERKTRALCTRYGLNPDTFASPVNQRPVELEADVMVDLHQALDAVTS